MSNMNPVVHFEMPYEDQNRMVEFYSKTFGWKPHVLGPEMGNYVVVDTTERDEATRFPKEAAVSPAARPKREPVEGYLDDLDRRQN